MTLRILLFFLLPLLGMAQTNSKVEMPMVGNTTSEKQALEIKRNVQYNLEEIKVRWKKAALENCPGVPCIITPPPPSFTCGTSTVSDVDGNIYNTVAIGTGTTAQCWTVTNLRVRRYNDGTEIRFDNSGGSLGTVSQTWAGTGLNYGAHTLYAHDSVTTPSSNLSNYGYLYNWYAVNDTRRLCPSGWHVPTDAEWTTLETYLNTVAPTGSAGGKMKSTSSLWFPPNTGANNTSGFSALPGGYRNNDGSFVNISVGAFFWSATEVDSNLAWNRALGSFISNVNRSSNFKSVGASVRCLRD
jgi:uncharacterized protein (TIGR02145 family)